MKNNNRRSKNATKNNNSVTSDKLDRNANTKKNWVNKNFDKSVQPTIPIDIVDGVKKLSSSQDLCEIVNSLKKSFVKASDKHDDNNNNDKCENENGNSSKRLHNLLHFSPDKGMERVQFEQDKCPVCNYLVAQKSFDDTENITPLTDSSSPTCLSATNSSEIPQNPLSTKHSRFRVRSVSDISESVVKESLDKVDNTQGAPNSAKTSFSFTFEFSSSLDDPPSSTGISVDLTNCSHVSFHVHRLPQHDSLFQKRHNHHHYHRYHPVYNFPTSQRFSYTQSCQYLMPYFLQQRYVLPTSETTSTSNVTSISTSPYVSIVIPNSLKRCFFCRSNLTICYECRGSSPGFFSNFSYSCSACKTCNYNEYSDLLSKAACIIAEPIQTSRNNDIFDSLKTCLIPHHFLSYYKVNAPPGRNWLNIDQPKDGFSFTLMCYNVLCQKYATHTQYPYCPAFALDWDYRKRGILEEIWKYNAEIICLQELEKSQFDTVFMPDLESRNYDGLFVPKSRYRTMTEIDCKGVDGCAIFWKKDSFIRKHHIFHEFMLSVLNVSKSPSPELLNRVMSRDNVALSVILECKDPRMNKKQICVSNGHIHWDPEFSDVKLIQTIFWTTELWNFLKDYQEKNDWPGKQSGQQMPVILCGDLNSLPDSGVIDYLMNGEVDRAHCDFKDLGQKYLFDEWVSFPKEFLKNDVLKHHFNFNRAYKEAEESGLKWTNYTYDFRGIIDYIFFSAASFRLLGSLQQIPEDWFEGQKIVGAPHVHINSDHFSLLVELELLLNNDPNVIPTHSSSISIMNSHKTVTQSNPTSNIPPNHFNMPLSNISKHHHHHHNMHHHHHHQQQQQQQLHNSKAISNSVVLNPNSNRFKNSSSSWT